MTYSLTLATLRDIKAALADHGAALPTNRRKEVLTTAMWFRLEGEAAYHEFMGWFRSRLAHYQRKATT